MPPKDSELCWLAGTPETQRTDRRIGCTEKTRRSFKCVPHIKTTTADPGLQSNCFSRGSWLSLPWGEGLWGSWFSQQFRRGEKTGWVSRPLAGSWSVAVPESHTHNHTQGVAGAFLETMWDFSILPEWYNRKENVNYCEIQTSAPIRLSFQKWWSSSASLCFCFPSPDGMHVICCFRIP